MYVDIYLTFSFITTTILTFIVDWLSVGGDDYNIVESNNSYVYVTFYQNEKLSNFTFTTVDDDIVEDFEEYCYINITDVRPDERIFIAENRNRYSRKYNYTKIIIRDDDGKWLLLYFDCM